MSKIDQLAETLFIKFQHEFPLTDDKVTGKKLKNLATKSIEQKLERFYAEAREMRKSHGLWVINWARVVMKLQQRLLHDGYPPEVVSKLLMSMLFTAQKSS